MAEQGKNTGNLGTARARAEFRRAHHDFLYQAAMGVSGSCEMAEKLTERLFSMMEASYEDKELPYGVELYMLSRLHRLYAEENPTKNAPTAGQETAEAPQAIMKEAPQPVAERSPQPVKEEAPQPVEERMPQPVQEEAPQPVAERAPQPIKEEAPQVVEVHAPQVVREEAKPALTAESASPSADKSERVSRSASMHRRRRAQNRSFPAQSAAQTLPMANAVPSELMRPLMVRLPNGTQTYFAPQSFLVQPLYPAEGAPQAVQPERAETVGVAPSVPSLSNTASAAPTEASYDPSLTEFWQPKAEKTNANQPTPPASKPAESMAKPTAPAPKPEAPAPKPAAKPVAPPMSFISVEAREQEEQRMRRSVTLTIVNTFLFLGLLTAITYLLMELGLLPKLF